MSELDVSTCVCGVRLPVSSGPEHVYVPATPACWESFGLLQTDEYERFGYSSAHGLIVDSYMASHPGSPDRRNRQSIVLHVTGLCAALEFNFALPERVRLLQSLAHVDYPAWEWQGPPEDGSTVLDLMFPADEKDLLARANSWAARVWAAWSPHAQQARELVLSLKP